jgi:PTH1 family peptidyl-tRNA hydrolase
MKLIVGIGNPGRRYEQTRHNLGALVVDHLSDEHGIPLSRRRFDALVGRGVIGEETVLLVKPQTYVNLSGKAVAPLMRWHRCVPEDILVVCDDLNLTLGQLRLRRKGSSGGHNGLKSVSEALGTDDYPRLRIGIGDAQERGAVSHVLGRFDQEERATIQAAIGDAARAARIWLERGIDEAMNKCNR